MTGSGPVRVEKAGGVASVTLDRPEKMNALSAGLVDGLAAIVAEAGADGTRLLALQGEGKNFSAGFDFSTYTDESEGDLLLRFVRIEQLLQAVHHAPFETAAFAHGRNFGAGVDLFCACSRRFAAPGATFRMPGLQFGIVLGTRRLADLIGPDRARAILWSSETFDAETAQSLGLVEAIIAPEDWAAKAEAIATSGRALTLPAIEALCGRTRGDSRADDLFALVQSASAPGLKARIGAYLERVAGR